MIDLMLRRGIEDWDRRFGWGYAIQLWLPLEWKTACLEQALYARLIVS